MRGTCRCRLWRRDRTDGIVYATGYGVRSVRRGIATASFWCFALGFRLALEAGTEWDFVATAMT